MSRLSQRQLRAVTPVPGRDIRLWDDSPRGLGVRIKPSGTISFFVQFESPVSGRRVRQTLGQFGTMSLDDARREAMDVLRDVRQGRDPAAERQKRRADAKGKTITMNSLCDDYMRDANAGLVTYRGRPKKPSTLADDTGRVERHIKPLLGDRLVAEITDQDINRFLHDVRKGKTAVTVKSGRPRGVARVTGGDATAARTVDLLGSIFSYAMRQSLRDTNPVKSIDRPPSRRRDRVLSPADYLALGNALADLEAGGANLSAVVAIRAIALTGCRRGEILSLEREAIDAHRQVLRLADTKTGQQLRPIGAHALNILQTAPVSPGNKYVFPATRGDGHLVGINVFRKAVAKAGLDEVSIHTLRHAFASTALELEYSELTIAGLLGHRSHSVTSRYAHHVDRSLVAAADRVSLLIAQRMGFVIDESAK